LFLLCLTLSVLDGFDTMVMSFLAPAISQDWGASHAAFGLVFSATLLGGAVGASFCGTLADRFGRRWLVLGAVLWFALLTLACAASVNLTALIAMRFLAGLGLGGAIPNLLALGGEYAPARQRSTVVAVITWGTPLGAVAGGLLTPAMLDAWGWRSVLYLAGAAPLALLPVAWFGLPESARFLAARGASQATLEKALGRVLGRGRVAALGVLRFTEATIARPGPAALFRDGLAGGTVLLAATMFTSLILSFFLVNWSPTLLKLAGLQLKDAILVTIALNLAGIVGSLVIARIVDRRANGPAVLALTYLCAVAALGVAAWVTRAGHAQFAPVVLALAAAGFFLIGSQITMSALITGFFPTQIRATGVGFNNAFARCGSLVGPAAGGLLLGYGLSPAQLLLAGMIPGGLSALFLLVFATLVSRRERRSPAALDARQAPGIL